MLNLEPKRLSPATTTGATRTSSTRTPSATGHSCCGCDRCLVATATSRALPSMARPTKTQQFAIWEDAQPPRCTRSSSSLRDDDVVSDDGGDDSGDSTVLHRHHHQQRDDAAAAAAAAADDDDDERRRESAFTSTSVSSLPDSALETDDERGALTAMQMHTPYTPPMIRPSFRRPASVKRMQMSSPTPSERSLRRSVLSPPRSVKSSVNSASRRQKLLRGDTEADKNHYPLVLLHLTLLPVELRWSRQSMEDFLPTSTLEALQLLESKVSDTIIQRGILIPHPRDDYELLEERLLEALELQKERISRGHFRARESTSSADSGVGSSVEGVEDDNCCDTCHAKIVDSAVTAGGRKWSIKVFAANGLMRASAWTAAWSEMERVDVEISPWIDEDLRRTLDARALQDAADEREKQEEEAVRTSEAEEHFRLLQQERPRARKVPTEHQTNHDGSGNDTGVSRGKVDDLPRVYQPKDIPLSLLLKNYCYLLAQDKRNIAILGLAMLALLLSLRVLLLPRWNMSALSLDCESTQPTSSRAESIYTANLVSVQPSSFEQDAITAIVGEHITSALTSSTAIPSPPIFGSSVGHEPVREEILRRPSATLQEATQDPALQTETFILDQAQCPNMASVVLVFEAR